MGRDLRRIFCRVLRIHIAMSYIARLRYQIELCLAYLLSLSELKKDGTSHPFKRKKNSVSALLRDWSERQIIRIRSLRELKERDEGCETLAHRLR